MGLCATASTTDFDWQRMSAAGENARFDSLILLSGFGIDQRRHAFHLRGNSGAGMMIAMSTSPGRENAPSIDDRWPAEKERRCAAWPMPSRNPFFHDFSVAQGRFILCLFSLTLVVTVAYAAKFHALSNSACRSAFHADAAYARAPAPEIRLRSIKLIYIRLPLPTRFQFRT